MITPSFRLKIALLSATVSGVVLVGFGTAAFVLISRQKTASMDTEIRAMTARHPGWITRRRDFEHLDETLEFIFGESRQQEVIVLVKSSDGELLHRSVGWPDAVDPALVDFTLSDDPEAEGEDLETGGGGFRDGRGWGGGGPGRGPGRGRGFGGGGNASAGSVFTKIAKFETLATASGTWRLGVFGTPDTTLVVGLNAAPAREELNQLRNRFLWALPAALFLVGLGGWLVAGRALRPMRGIARMAEQITARGLDQRIPDSDEDPEITRMIHMLNGMMDRLESSFHQATRFSADASHELRTPLAIMQGELELALQEAATESKDQRVFSNLLEETQRLKSIMKSLLLLARADAGELKPALEEVDLSALLEDLIEDARILAEDMRLEFETDIALGIIVSADAALLHTALLNLLVNAVKYNEPGGRVLVSLTSGEGRLLLRIGNTGPGIPAADQAHVFARFQRVDRARQRKVDGVGLGLSLAAEIIRAHGGGLELEESRPGWTSFVVRW